MKVKRKSKILVNILDLSKDRAEATKTCKSLKDKNCIDIKTLCEFGYIETPTGIYSLNSEGIGGKFPVTKKNPLEIDLYGKYDENGEISADAIPCMLLKIDNEDIKKIPVLKQVNLGDFIRSFGVRLESNFNEWNAFLTREMKTKQVV